MRKALTAILMSGFLAAGLLLMVLGIRTMFESRSIPTGDDASAALILGFLAAAVGSCFFLAAGFASRLSKPPGNRK